MAAPSTNPAHFTPKVFDGTWAETELEQNYKDLYKEYNILSAELEGGTRPFGRERTLHNLLNARRTLEHDIERLKNAFVVELEKSQRNLEELRKAPPAVRANYKIEAELRKELQHSRDTLNEVLIGITQSQDSTCPAPSDSSATLRLMKDTVRLQVEKSGLLIRLSSSERKKRKLRQQRDDLEIENGNLHEEADEKDNEIERLQGEVDHAVAECEILRTRVRRLEEALRIR